MIANLLTFMLKTMTKIVFNQNIDKHSKENKYVNKFEINMQINELNKQKKSLIERNFSFIYYGAYLQSL